MEKQNLWFTADARVLGHRYTGCPQKKKTRILIIYTPNQMVVSRLQNGLINSRIAPMASRLNCQKKNFQRGLHTFF
jgi:hypothetical protein